jgi:hypothetical protein
MFLHLYIVPVLGGVIVEDEALEYMKRELCNLGLRLRHSSEGLVQRKQAAWFAHE